MVEVLAVVLMWKLDEAERLKEKFGDDLGFYPAFVVMALDEYYFPEKRWKKDFYDKGVTMILPGSYLIDVVKDELGEDWVFGIVFHDKTGREAPSEKDVREAIRSGKIIRMHPDDHELAFRVYLCWKKKYISLLERIKQILKEERYI